MKEDIFEKYRDAGILAAKILRSSSQRIRVGASYLDLVELIEEQVTEEGAELAFPLNLSLNEDAAHDTASPGDERVFTKGDVVKLDLGVQLDGYIADTATTIDLGNNSLLLEASEQALESALKLVCPGVTAGELGSAIQKEIESRGYRPISNLTGHGLDRYILHRQPTIPNVGISGGVVLEEGMVFAIEPFATTGSGHVGEKPVRRFIRRFHKNLSGFLQHVQS
jgi:methionyl aminopeptidase